MGGLEFLLLPLLLLGLLWVMGAPQRKMRKEQAALLQSLAPGTDVMTHGGLYGTVVEIEDDVVVLETTPGVTMRWAKRAIATVVTPPADEAAEDSDEDLEDEEYTEDEYTDEEYSEDEAVDEYGESSEETADDWEDVEVPDDASSLTPDDDGDGDDKPTR